MQDAFFQGLNRLFVLAFNNVFTTTATGAEFDDAKRVQRSSHRKYFLTRVNISNSNILVDSRNFYDQPINDEIKQYDEITKIATRKGDDYTTGCLLDYQHFKNHLQINFS